MSKQVVARKAPADEKWRRIIREELQTNILVEAGAGSGKTQMLAERMAAGVASGVYTVEHLAAVTFTRKAASELRGRFHIALEKELESGLPTDKEARVRHALSNLERFFAGTIHSFCARLLRERPVEAGVSPGFTELDEVQDEELRNRAWRDFISNSRADGNAEMLELLETGVRPRELDSAFATICLNEDVEFPPGDGVCPAPEPAYRALEKFWKALEPMLPSAIPDETTCSIQKAARQFRRQLRVARKKLNRASTITDLLATWECKSTITQKWWNGSSAETKRLKAEIERLHGDFRETVVQPYLSQWRQYVYRLSVALLTRARDYASAERHRRNSLNYGDLLILAAKVLRENACVRRALQAKYRHLFVDEFQDTDPIQAEIVFLLAAAETTDAGRRVSSADDAGPGDPDWRTVPIRPGALFVVGDPKQSIYRFRRADIEIYALVRDRFSDPTVGKVVPLTTNFRSVRALCEWANDVFDGPFPKKQTPYSPRFARLDAWDQSISSTGGVFTLTHTTHDYRDVPEQDADAIARYIRAEVDAGRRTFSDFLILTRKKKDRLAPYAAALEQLNVPIEVSGAGAFGESVEVKALTTLLRALADPQDALPLVAVLRGAFFGLSDAELFAFKQAGGWFTIFYEAKIPIPPALQAAHDVVTAALQTLRQYHRWTRMLPAGAALDRILEHSGYLALAATTPGGVEAGDLLHAVDRVRQVFDEGGGIDDAADALEADGEFTSEVESLPLEPGRSDVVRLMNLHKAKGLEADVVFLADPCGGVKPPVNVHIERRGNQALGWFKVEKKFERGATTLGVHADWQKYAEAELPFKEAEETRLLYVAATRARDMLVVSRQAVQKGTPAWGVLNANVAPAKELSVPEAAAIAPVRPLDCSKAAQAAERATLSSVQDRARVASWSITSVTAEAHHIARMTRATDAAVDDPTKVVSQATPARRADAGMAWGALIHGLLEHAMRHKGATRDDLRRLAIWLTVEEPQLRPVLDLALLTVYAVAGSPFWDTAAKTDHATEVPFAVCAGSSEVLTGAMDLLFKDEPQWRVVDYKTDVSDVDGLAGYQRQLDLYKEALARLGMDAVAELRPVRVATPDQRS